MNAQETPNAFCQVYACMCTLVQLVVCVTFQSIPALRSDHMQTKCAHIRPKEHTRLGHLWLTSVWFLPFHLIDTWQEKAGPDNPNQTGSLKRICMIELLI